MLTLPTAAASPWDGLNFMYTPDWAALAKPAVWLAAAGQIFFTLSVGMGTLSAYASYLKKDDDIALSGLATAPPTRRRRWSWADRWPSRPW